MGDCVPTPTTTQFATHIDVTVLQTTTFQSGSTSVSVQTGSFPSTICTGSDGNGCSILIITYRITSTSTTLVPTTSTVISHITHLIPKQTLFAPCTIADDPPSPPNTSASTSTNANTNTLPNGVSTSLSQSDTTLPNGSVSVTMGSSGQTHDSGSDSPNTNHAAIIGGAVSAVVILSIIAFLMWTLWKKNRAMKAALAEHERKEGEVNIAQFLPTPYPITSPAPGAYDAVYAAGTASPPTPRNPSSYDYSSAYTHQQGAPGAFVYSKSPSTDPESDSVTNDTRTHTHTHSLRPATASSQTHSIATLQPLGPSGVTTSSHPSEHQWTSAGAEAKAREARMETTLDGRLRAVNITEGGEVDRVHPPLAWVAPPPAYSQEE